MKLIDKIKYYLEHFEEKDFARELFSQEEWDILQTIREREKRKAEVEIRGSNVEKAFGMIEAEKEISLRLKEQVIYQINILLERESIEAWLEILTWYQLLKGRQLVKWFWEFRILEIILEIFQEELRAVQSKESTVSVLLLHSMDELLETYFQTVFLLRRLEYEMGTVEEFQNYAQRSGLSSIFFGIIIARAQIDNKEKVIRKIATASTALH